MNSLKKILRMLTSAQRKSAFGLLGLMSIGMLLEMMGIGLVVPVIGLMMQGGSASRFLRMQFIREHLNFLTNGQIITTAMIALLCAFVIKNIYLGFLAWRQIRFSSDVQIKLSERLFAIYLNQPYAFYLKRNSAQLMRNVIGEVNVFSGAISHLLQVVAESLVVIGIGILLLIVEPVGALMVLVGVGGVGWVMQSSTRTRITTWGLARQLHDGLRIQYLQEGIGGVKDVKILGREADFLTKHSKHNSISARAGELQMTLQQVPRLFLELLAVLGLVLLVTTMISQGKNLDGIMPTLGLFAASAFRLMPSASRILSSLQVLRFSLPVVNTLSDEIELECSAPIREKVNGNISFSKRLELVDVSYAYDGADSPALRNVSIQIGRGETIGIIGASGSGKSTLVDVILGLLKVDSGKIEVDSKDIEDNLRAWQNKIGYVPQIIFLTDDSLRRNVAFGLPDDEIDDEAVLSAIKSAQLDKFISTLPQGLETVVGERGVRLSGGQRQRIGIARALYHDPEVLVLDEATSSLDTDTERSVMGAIEALHGSKTIIVVAHRMSTVEYCDQIYRLVNGSVAERGTPKEILKINFSDVS